MDIVKDIITNKPFLLTWDGRINREPYWMFLLVVIAGAIVVEIIGSILHMPRFLGGVYNLALLYPSICVQIKRWHDRGKSGWWCLINLIPVIGWIWALVECGFLPGTPGSNEFGADPLGGSPSATV